MLATISELLLDVANALRRLARGYDAIARTRERSDPVVAQFAAFLSAREQTSVEALEKYVERDEHHAALDVRVRLGSGFPFSTNGLEIPANASLDELGEIARQTDTLLTNLTQRVALYAASGELGELLTAIDEIALRRERELGTALQELESLAPSPPRSHKP